MMQPYFRMCCRTFHFCHILYSMPQLDQMLTTCINCMPKPQNINVRPHIVMGNCILQSAAMFYNVRLYISTQVVMCFSKMTAYFQKQPRHCRWELLAKGQEIWSLRMKKYLMPGACPGVLISGYDIRYIPMRMYFCVLCKKFL